MYLYTPRVMIARRSISKGRRMERMEARDMEEEGGVVGDVGGSRGTRGRMVSGGGIVLI